VDGSVRLLSRRGNDLSRLCPGVSVLGTLDLAPAVLDGEIVAFAVVSRASRRCRQDAPTSGLEDGAFLAFDLPWLRGESPLARPYVSAASYLNH
jgi:ATP-dependent DNA ligase